MATSELPYYILLTKWLLFEVYMISSNQSHSAALLRSKLSFCRFIDDSYRWYDVNEGYTARAVCKIQNCPQGFIEYNNKCLRVVNSRRNRWAEYYCKIFMKRLLNSIHYITNTSWIIFSHYNTLKQCFLIIIVLMVQISTWNIYDNHRHMPGA